MTHVARLKDQNYGFWKFQKVTRFCQVKSLTTIIVKLQCIFYPFLHLEKAVLFNKLKMYFNWMHWDILSDLGDDTGN